MDPYAGPRFSGANYMSYQPNKFVERPTRNLEFRQHTQCNMQFPLQGRQQQGISDQFGYRPSLQRSDHPVPGSQILQGSVQRFNSEMPPPMQTYEFNNSGFPNSSPVSNYCNPAPVAAYCNPSNAVAFSNSTVAPRYSTPQSAPVYSNPPSDQVYSNPSAAPIYPNPAAAPIYPNPSASPVYPNPAAAPVYPNSATGPVYSNSTTAPMYANTSAAPGYSNPPSVPAYSNPPAAPLYSNPPSAPVYSNPPAAPVYSNPPSVPYSTPSAAPGFSNASVGPRYVNHSINTRYSNSLPNPEYSNDSSISRYSKPSRDFSYGTSNGVPMAEFSHAKSPVRQSMEMPFNSSISRYSKPSQTDFSYGPSNGVIKAEFSHAKSMRQSSMETSFNSSAPSSNGRYWNNRKQNWNAKKNPKMNGKNFRNVADCKKTFSCDTCDRHFAEQAKLTEHFALHRKCGIKGCQFEAHPRLVEMHKKHMHLSGYAEKLMTGNTPEDIAKWINDRKRKFPTRENKQKNEAAQEEKEARGEVLENRYFGKVKKQRLNEESAEQNQPPRGDITNRGRWGRRGRRSRNSERFSVTDRSIKGTLLTEDTQSDSDVDEEAHIKLPMFAGILKDDHSDDSPSLIKESFSPSSESPRSFPIDSTLEQICSKFQDKDNNNQIPPNHKESESAFVSKASSINTSENYPEKVFDCGLTPIEEGNLPHIGHSNLPPSGIKLTPGCCAHKQNEKNGELSADSLEGHCSRVFFRKISGFMPSETCPENIFDEGTCINEDCDSQCSEGAEMSAPGCSSVHKKDNPKDQQCPPYHQKDECSESMLSSSLQPSSPCLENQLYHGIPQTEECTSPPPANEEMTVIACSSVRMQDNKQDCELSPSYKEQNCSGSIANSKPSGDMTPETCFANKGSAQSSTIDPQTSPEDDKVTEDKVESDDEPTIEPIQKYNELNGSCGNAMEVEISIRETAVDNLDSDDEAPSVEPIIKCHELNGSCGNSVEVEVSIGETAVHQNKIVVPGKSTEDDSKSNVKAHPHPNRGLKKNNKHQEQKMRPNLLERLLANEIRHERNVLLQCIRYSRMKSFKLQ